MGTFQRVSLLQIQSIIFCFSALGSVFFIFPIVMLAQETAATSTATSSEEVVSIETAPTTILTATSTPELEVGDDGDSATIASTTSTSTLGDIFPGDVGVLKNTTSTESIAAGVSAPVPMRGDLIEDTVFTKADSPYYLLDLTVPEGIILTIEAGAILKFGRSTSNTPGGLAVHGSIVIEGTEGDPVYLTADRDDSIGGDTNGDGDASEPGPGYWKQLRIMPGASANISHTTFRYGGYGHGGLARCFENTTWCRGSLMNAGTLNANNLSFSDSLQYSFHNLDGTATITNSFFDGVTIRGDVEIFAERGTTTIRNSSIVEVTNAKDPVLGRGVVVGSSGVADAKENWWGDVSGPREPVK